MRALLGRSAWQRKPLRYFMFDGINIGDAAQTPAQRTRALLRAIWPKTRRDYRGRLPALQEVLCASRRACLHYLEGDRPLTARHRATLAAYVRSRAVQLAAIADELEKETPAKAPQGFRVVKDRGGVVRDARYSRSNSSL